LVEGRGERRGLRGGGRRQRRMGRGDGGGAVRVDRQASGVGGRLGNSATYAGWVQGSRSAVPGQSRLMQRLGWTSIDDVWNDANRARIMELFRRALMKSVKG